MGECGCDASMKGLNGTFLLTTAGKDHSYGRPRPEEMLYSLRGTAHFAS